VLGQAGHALLIDTRTLDVEPLPFDTGARDLALLILDTKVQHSVGSGEYAERRSSCEKAAQALDLPALRDANLQDLERLEDELLKRRARHVVTENDRVLATAGRLREGDLTGIGPLMSASHESLRDDFEVSAPELDAVVAAALRAGALGARMTGAGFGGSAIALVAADREDPVREAVLEALPACEIVPAEPSDGARRLA
jgi:galactokinase